MTRPTTLNLLRAAARQAREALDSAQESIASSRPAGSSDPASDQYDDDAFVWDYYQRAIDALTEAIAAPGP